MSTSHWYKSGVAILLVLLFSSSLTIAQECPFTDDVFVANGTGGWNHDQNYDYIPQVWAGYGQNSVFRGLLKCDFSGVPNGTQVDEALFRFHHSQSTTGTRIFEFRRIVATRNWTETGENWDTSLDLFGGPLIATLTIPEDWDAIQYVDFTSVVQGWINGDFPNNGFTVTVQDENNHEYWGFFAHEHTGPDDWTPLIIINGGSGGNGEIDHIVLTDISGDEVTINNPDMFITPDNVDGYEFAIYHDPDAGSTPHIYRLTSDGGVDMSSGEVDDAYYTFAGLAGPDSYTVWIDQDNGGEQWPLTIEQYDNVDWSQGQTYDFGTVVLPDYIDQVLNVQNEGNSAIDVTFTEPDHFSVLTATPVHIEPGESAPVDIRFQPIDPGAYSEDMIAHGDNDDQMPITLTGFAESGWEPPTGLYINEFQADNDDTIQDPQGDFDDWIELYNGGDQQIDLSGYYLSDNATNPTAWMFPVDTNLGSGEYLLVWADEDINDTPGLHADFKLNQSGEEVVLTAPDGSTLIDQYTFGLQIADHSMGRDPDGSDNWVDFAVPTPGGSNEGFEPLTVVVEPFNPPVVLPPVGGTFTYDVEITYNLQQPNTGHIWLAAELPSGNVVNVPVSQYNDYVVFDFVEGSVINQDFLTQQVPAGAPAGVYQWMVRVGWYPTNYVAAQGSFSFEKQGFVAGAESVWPASSGWNSQLLTKSVSEAATREGDLPDRFCLAPAYPNPFNPTVTLSVALPDEGELKLTIHDITGRLVQSVVDGPVGAGSHAFVVDGTQWASGVYIARAVSNGQVVVQKLTLLR